MLKRNGIYITLLAVFSAILCVELALVFLVPGAGTSVYGFPKSIPAEFTSEQPFSESNEEQTADDPDSKNDEVSSETKKRPNRSNVQNKKNRGKIKTETNNSVSSSETTENNQKNFPKKENRDQFESGSKKIPGDFNKTEKFRGVFDNRASILQTLRDLWIPIILTCVLVDVVCIIRLMQIANKKQNNEIENHS